MTFLITCEHALNTVPPDYAELFRGKEAILETHMAYDEGAADAALYLAQRLDCKPVLGSCTRLLTDLNRSPSNRSVFSDFTAHLSGTEKEKILKTYHEPFRKSVTKAFRCCTFPVIHISVHSFTPVFKGKERNVDIGLLFDPARENEKHFAAFLGRAFKDTDFRVRMNSPYQGKTDGTATWLRTLHHGGSYIGLELELNQSLIKSGKFEKPLLEKIADRILEYVQ